MYYKMAKNYMLILLMIKFVILLNVFFSAFAVFPVSLWCTEFIILIAKQFYSSIDSNHTRSFRRLSQIHEWKQKKNVKHFVPSSSHPVSFTKPTRINTKSVIKGIAKNLTTSSLFSPYILHNPWLEHTRTMDR